MTGARPRGRLSPAPPGREPEPGLDAMILDEDSPRLLVALGEAACVRVSATGPDPGKDRVIEIVLTVADFGGVDTDGDPRPDTTKTVRGQSTYATRVNPGTPVPAKVLAAHGLRAADLEGAPRFGEIAGEVRAFIGTLPVIGGKTLARDKAFLSAELRRAGVDTLDRNPSPRVYCRGPDLPREPEDWLDDDWDDDESGLPSVLRGTMGESDHRPRPAARRRANPEARPTARRATSADTSPVRLEEDGLSGAQALGGILFVAAAVLLLYALA